MPIGELQDLILIPVAFLPFNPFQQRVTVNPITFTTLYQHEDQELGSNLLNKHRFFASNHFYPANNVTKTKQKQSKKSKQMLKTYKSI